MAGVMDDVRNALGQWRRAPGPTAIALLSLTLGIGAGLALFSLVDALLWKSLPVREPDRLARLVARHDRGQLRDIGVPTQVVDHIRAQQSTFDGVSAIAPTAPISPPAAAKPSRWRTSTTTISTCSAWRQRAQRDASRRHQPRTLAARIRHGRARRSRWR